MLGLILIGLGVVVGSRIASALEVNAAANLLRERPPEPPKLPKSLTGLNALRQFTEGGKG